MLKWPAQCDGLPIILCSSKTVTAAPNLDSFRAVKEPTGPPPTTMTSATSFINCTLSISNVGLLYKLDASFSAGHGSSADFSADFQPQQDIVEVFIP